MLNGKILKRQTTLKHKQTQTIIDLTDLIASRKKSLTDFKLFQYFYLKFKI